MYQIKMINGDKFDISDETFNKLAGKSGLIYIPELKGIINLTSVASVLEKEMSESSGNRKKYKDGYAINKYGTWIDEYSGVKIDVHHYPELAKDENVKQLNRGGK